MCPRERMNRKPGIMNFETYRKIIDDAASIDVPHVRLFMFGEPLLHPKLIEMIKYAKSKNIPKVDFNTNATLLNKKISREIIDSGLDRIIFSVDGINKKTYESVRRGGKYQKVVKNIEYFMQLKNNLSRGPHTILQTIVMNQTKPEITSFEGKWKSVVDEVSVTELNTYGGMYKFSNKEKTNKRQACNQLWDRLIVLCNGVVTVCCEDYNGMLAIGHVDDGIRKLWKNEKIKHLRNLHLKQDFGSIPLCDKCDATWM